MTFTYVHSLCSHIVALETTIITIILNAVFLQWKFFILPHSIFQRQFSSADTACTVVQYFVCTYIFYNFSHAYLDVLWSVFICACYDHAEMAEPIEVPFGATWRIRLICVVDCDMPLPRITVVNCAIWHNLVRVLHCYTTLWRKFCISQHSIFQH